VTGVEVETVPDDECAPAFVALGTLLPHAPNNIPAPITKVGTKTWTRILGTLTIRTPARVTRLLVGTVVLEVVRVERFLCPSTTISAMRRRVKHRREWIFQN